MRTTYTSGTGRRIGKVIVVESNATRNSVFHGVKVFRASDKSFIGAVETTAMFGHLNYMSKHPDSKYTKKFRELIIAAGETPWL